MLDGDPFSFELRDLGDVKPGGIEEFRDAGSRLELLTQMTQLVVAEVGKDPLTHVGEKVAEVGGVALDHHALPVVVIGEALDLGPEDGWIDVVLVEDRLLHVPRDEGAVEVPHQGDHRLGMQWNRHSR